MPCLSLIPLQGARACNVLKLTFMSQAVALQGSGDMPRTADRRASDAEAKALRLQRWKERNAGSSLLGSGSGSGSADGKSQPAASLGTRHGHGGHRSRSQSKSPPASRRRSSQEDGELAGTLPSGVWALCMADTWHLHQAGTMDGWSTTLAGGIPAKLALLCPDCSLPGINREGSSWHVASLPLFCACSPSCGRPEMSSRRGFWSLYLLPPHLFT